MPDHKADHFETTMSDMTPIYIPLFMFVELVQNTPDVICSERNPFPIARWKYGLLAQNLSLKSGDR